MAKSKRTHAENKDKKTVAIAQQACRDATAAVSALKGLSIAEKEAASQTPSPWALADLEMWQKRADKAEDKTRESRLKLQAESRKSALAWRIAMKGQYDRDKRDSRKSALREEMTDSMIQKLGVVNTGVKMDRIRILNEMTITTSTVLTQDLYHTPKIREAKMAVVASMLSDGVDVFWD